MPDLRNFSRGDAITADRLNPLVASARRTLGTPGAPGATIASPTGPVIEIPVVVVARAVTSPAVLSAHQYTVRGGGQEWEVDYTRLMVDVEPGLIDSGNPPMGFAPAEKAGEGMALMQPWRAWGKLVRFAGADGARDYAVRLYGLVPARGC